MLIKHDDLTKAAGLIETLPSLDIPASKPKEFK